MSRDETHTVTTLRTGVTEDGLLELQLIYGNNRGSSLWFRLTKAQAQKIARDVEALPDEPTPQRQPLHLTAVD